MKLDDAKSIVDEVFLNIHSRLKFQRSLRRFEAQKLNTDPDLDPAYVNLYFNHNEAN